MKKRREDFLKLNLNGQTDCEGRSYFAYMKEEAG